MTKVVVIGGGVVGAAVTFRLARLGAPVTLLEADRLAAGTSGATTGWTNASRKKQHEYFLLCAAGMAEHMLLEQELGEGPWMHQHGNLEWAESDEGWDKLDARVARLQEWGYGAKWLTPSEAAAHEPHLRLPENVERAVLFPAEGHVDTPVLIGRLVEEAVREGATLRTGCRVASIDAEGGAIGGVTTDDGERISADVVVNCAGPWAQELLRSAGVECPMAPSVGLIAISTPTTIRLRGNVHTPLLSLQPDGAGRIMMRGEKWDRLIEETTPEQPVPQACDLVLYETLKYLPGMAGARIEAARIGVRPCPADKHPAIGPVPGVDGLFLACMHSGVTMAPLVGRMLATEIVRGTVDERLEHFRPARLIEAGVGAA